MCRAIGAGFYYRRGTLAATGRGVVIPPPVVLRTTAKGGGHSGVAISSLITVCAGAGRRWAFWGDHPGGVAATPPQRGTLAAMGRESVPVHWVVIVSPPPVVLRTTPPRQRRWVFGCGHLVANHCLCGARAAVGIPGRPPRRRVNHKFSKILSRRSARSSVSSYSNLISGTYF